MASWAKGKAEHRRHLRPGRSGVRVSSPERDTTENVFGKQEEKRTKRKKGYRASHEATVTRNGGSKEKKRHPPKVLQ